MCCTLVSRPTTTHHLRWAGVAARIGRGRGHKREWGTLPHCGGPPAGRSTLHCGQNNCLCACARSAQPLRFPRIARFISACPAVGSVPVIRPPSARARLRRSVPRLRSRTGCLVLYGTERRGTACDPSGVKGQVAPGLSSV